MVRVKNYSRPPKNRGELMVLLANSNKEINNESNKLDVLKMPIKIAAVKDVNLVPKKREREVLSELPKTYGDNKLVTEISCNTEQNDIFNDAVIGAEMIINSNTINDYYVMDIVQNSSGLGTETSCNTEQNDILNDTVIGTEMIINNNTEPNTINDYYVMDIVQNSSELGTETSCNTQQNDILNDTVIGAEMIINNNTEPNTINDYYVLDIADNSSELVTETYCDTEQTIILDDSVNGAEIIIDNTNEISELESIQSRNRKRSTLAKPKQWTKNMIKKQRMMGEAYMGYRRGNAKTATNFQIINDVPKSARVMGPTCESTICKKWATRSCDTITEIERQQLFHDFWKEMNWDSKRMYVCSTVEIRNTNQKTTKGISKRSSSYFYFLKVDKNKIPVCKNMYLSTLGLKTSEVNTWLSNFRDSNMPIKKRKESSDYVLQIEAEAQNPNAVDKNIGKTGFQKRDEILKKFFDSLPLLPSHYCRKYSTKFYIDTEVIFLQADIQSWSQLYEMYKLNCMKISEAPLSRNTFDRVRREKNIAICKPKKDKCDTCTLDRRGNILKPVHQKHIELRDSSRLEKEKDKAAALDGDCHTLCCDLMAVQSLPLLTNASAYYKLKLSIYNYTVYNLASHDAMTYWVDETQEASMCSSIFATCLVDYISELLDTSLKTVILYSDGCNYQNRNSVLSNALLHLSMNKNVTIIQKFLEKGHTEMECDSVHSLIQRKYENLEVYLPSQYALHSITARRSPMAYRAKQLDYTFFKNYSKEETMMYSSIRPGRRLGDPTVVDLRWLQYEPTGKILYKLDFNEKSPVEELPNRQKRKIPTTEFPRLYETRPTIKKDKYDDLQFLKRFMPSDVHGFYDTIPCETESIRQMNRKKKKENKQ